MKPHHQIFECRIQDIEYLIKYLDAKVYLIQWVLWERATSNQYTICNWFLLKSPAQNQLEKMSHKISLLESNRNQINILRMILLIPDRSFHEIRYTVEPRLSNIIRSKNMFDYWFVRKLKQYWSGRLGQLFDQFRFASAAIRTCSVFIGLTRVFELRTFVWSQRHFSLNLFGRTLNCSTWESFDNRGSTVVLNDQFLFEFFLFYFRSSFNVCQISTSKWIKFYQECYRTLSKFKREHFQHTPSW